jgi:uncharacterized protein
MNKPNTLHGLLQLVEASEGNVDSRIRMQKEAFLLAMAGFEPISTSSFSYHHYGPFSRELSDYLQFAVSANLLREQIEPGANDGKKYSYSLTARGSNYLKEAGSMPEDYTYLVKACKGEYWRTLELAATCLFLEHREEIDRAQALNKALSLKPDTLSYRDSALTFLQSHFIAKASF